MSEGKFTPGPWEYVPSTEHHGAYVAAPWGGDICDCYAMSDPSKPSTLNGGTSYPIPHQAERADANARLIAAAPDLLEALKEIVADDDAGVSLADQRARWDERMAAAKAAILKATGGAS